jgi:hypothetical protein
MLRCVILLLFLPSFVLAADLSKIKFGMSKHAVEKVLGEGRMRRDYENPEVSHSLRYFAAGENNIVPIGYFDRDLDLVAIVFMLINGENGGNDPKTGLPWRLPPEAGSRILATIAGRQSWTQKAGVWKSADGKFFAKVEDRRLVIARDPRILAMTELY